MLHILPRKCRVLFILGVLSLATFALAGLEARPAVDALILLYTNDTRGFLEDCGCQSRQRGGLARRATLIQQIRSECPQVLLLDSGNLSDTGLRVDTVLESMKRMGYQGSGLGVFDLLIGSLLFPAAQQKGLPLINSFPEGNRLPSSVQKSSLIQIGGRRVGVIGLSPAPQEPSPEEFYGRLEALLADLRPRVDLVVLLSQLGLERDRAVAQWQRDRHLIDLILGNREARALSAPEIVAGPEPPRAGVFDLSFGGLPPHGNVRLEG